jgi:hypothetical protein
MVDARDAGGMWPSRGSRAAWRGRARGLGAGSGLRGGWAMAPSEVDGKDGEQQQRDVPVHEHQLML